MMHLVREVFVVFTYEVGCNASMSSLFGNFLTVVNKLEAYGNKFEWIRPI